MQNKITKKTLLKIALLYVAIVGAINFSGFWMVTTQNMPVLHNEAYDYWLDYMDKHAALINFFSTAAFILPVIFCACYAIFCKPEKIAGRLINMPVSYAMIGSLGWVFSLASESVFLLKAYLVTGLSMRGIALSSFLNIVQCCIFITTLSFMSLTVIQRSVILPKYFPEGNLGQYPGSRNISTTAIIVIFYISVSVFPVFFLMSTLRNYSIMHQFEISTSFLIMVGIVIALDIVLTMSVASYFGLPLKILRDATEELKREQYGKKIELVSNDDFGILADSFNDMSGSIAEKNKRITSIQDSIIRGIAVMVESRDNSTGGHINRTSECVRVFVEKMRSGSKFELDDTFVKNIIKAAPMHDLGKIAIDDAILRKPGKFTPEEFEEMKKHAEEGARIVRRVLKEADEEFTQLAENVAHYHHEKWNGTGYPCGLSGNDIPFEARIMALADVFDALVSKRCYKESMDYDKAFGIIQDSLGTHFDPVLGEFFISCRDDLEVLYNELPE